MKKKNKGGNHGCLCGHLTLPLPLVLLLPAAPAATVSAAHHCPWPLPVLLPCSRSSVPAFALIHPHSYPPDEWGECGRGWMRGHMCPCSFHLIHPSPHSHSFIHTRICLICLCLPSPSLDRAIVVCACPHRHHPHPTMLLSSVCAHTHYRSFVPGFTYAHLVHLLPLLPLFIPAYYHCLLLHIVSTKILLVILLTLPCNWPALVSRDCQIVSL
jgi:hypothetical protein